MRVYRASCSLCGDLNITIPVTRAVRKDNRMKGAIIDTHFKLFHLNKYGIPKRLEDLDACVTWQSSKHPEPRRGKFMTRAEVSIPRDSTRPQGSSKARRGQP